MLREIQEAAVSRDHSITDLLRRCKILAARLGSRDFEEWVDLELNGYPPEHDLPPYRISEVGSKGTFVGGFGRQLKNGPIPLGSVPEEFRDTMRHVYLREPIGSYEDLLRHSDTSGMFQSPWPADLIAHVGTKIYSAMSCIGAWQEIPRGTVVSVVDTVRNRVLSFALEIERIAPSAGEGSPGPQPIGADTVTQVFHTHVYGNVGNIASGSRDVSQSAAISTGDFQALATELGRLGFSSSDVAELKQAFEEDGPETPGLGKRVTAWLAKAIGKAGDGLLKVPAQTAVNLLPKLVSAHLGLPTG